MSSYKVLGKKGNEIYSNTMCSAGEILEEELECRKIKKSDFAKKIGLHLPNLSELISGKRPISAAMAIKLETALGISADYWLRIQMHYDLKEARKKVKPNSK